MKAGIHALILWAIVPALACGQISEELLQVHFIDVGTGDCIYIQTGNDTILATTDGQTLIISYVGVATTTPGLDPTRCRAITQAGTQCKRKPSAGSVYCWQHRS